MTAHTPRSHMGKIDVCGRACQSCTHRDDDRRTLIQAAPRHRKARHGDNKPYQIQRDAGKEQLAEGPSCRDDDVTMCHQTTSRRRCRRRVAPRRSSLASRRKAPHGHHPSVIHEW